MDRGGRLNCSGFGGDRLDPGTNKNYVFRHVRNFDIDFRQYFTWCADEIESMREPISTTPFRMSKFSAHRRRNEKQNRLNISESRIHTTPYTYTRRTENIAPRRPFEGGKNFRRSVGFPFPPLSLPTNIFPRKGDAGAEIDCWKRLEGWKIFRRGERESIFIRESLTFPLPFAPSSSPPPVLCNNNNRNFQPVKMEVKIVVRDSATQNALRVARRADSHRRTHQGCTAREFSFRESKFAKRDILSGNCLSISWDIKWKGKGKKS